jgi:hypothetical protein
LNNIGFVGIGVSKLYPNHLKVAKQLIGFRLLRLEEIDFYHLEEGKLTQNIAG